ncbi:MAG: hypothetical protein Ct9H90mP20_3390 [Candidatus Neomarinimicrobiota bacterium]|nr:MAG: hypothetical protein Ct9H90mP20_3390 [Candidatus Neomarinimicrobiota bacterium]
MIMAQALRYPHSLNDEAEDAINRVLEILQNRIDQFGVAEPTIQKQGNQTYYC